MDQDKNQVASFSRRRWRLDSNSVIKLTKPPEMPPTCGEVAATQHGSINGPPSLDTLHPRVMGSYALNVRTNDIKLQEQAEKERQEEESKKRFQMQLIHQYHRSRVPAHLTHPYVQEDESKKRFQMQLMAAIHRHHRSRVPAHLTYPYIHCPGNLGGRMFMGPHRVHNDFLDFRQVYKDAEKRVREFNEGKKSEGDDSLPSSVLREEEGFDSSPWDDFYRTLG